VPSTTTRKQGVTATLPSDGVVSDTLSTLTTTDAPIPSGSVGGTSPTPAQTTTFAKCFTGVRQDSGDPEDFIQMMRDFYDSEGIKDTKTLVFSDSLNVELCLKYKAAAEKHGFQPTFGVGTFLTSMFIVYLIFICVSPKSIFNRPPKLTYLITDDFINISTDKKSVPLNIVIKLSSAAGRPAIKISDNIGKNTGDEAVVDDVKRRLGYHEKKWKEGDESSRWGKV
jgi:nicotinate phosphoribosyltransferase